MSYKIINKFLNRIRTTTNVKLPSTIDKVNDNIINKINPRVLNNIPTQGTMNQKICEGNNLNSIKKNYNEIQKQLQNNALLIQNAEHQLLNIESQLDEVRNNLESTNKVIEVLNKTIPIFRNSIKVLKRISPGHPVIIILENKIILFEALIRGVGGFMDFIIPQIGRLQQKATNIRNNLSNLAKVLNSANNILNTCLKQKLDDETNPNKNPQGIGLKALIDCYNNNQGKQLIELGLTKQNEVISYQVKNI